MADKVKPIPEGFHTVTPYLVVEGAARLLEFLKRAFGAQELEPPSTRPDGTILHAAVRIGDSPVMLAEASEPWKPMPTGIYLYVEDTDATYRRALEAGGTSLMEPADQFYGDRNAGVKDPSGNFWWISTHVEDVPPEEMKRRHEAMLQQQAQG
jgi:PhnB protein